jgi:ribosomal protein L39E
LVAFSLRVLVAVTRLIDREYESWGRYVAVITFILSRAVVVTPYEIVWDDYVVCVTINAVDRSWRRSRLVGGADKARDAGLTDDVVGSASTEQVGSRRRRVPTELTWSRRSSSARSIPSWKELKGDRRIGDCGMKVKDPKQIDSS